MTYIASVTYNGKNQVLKGLEYKNMRACKNELRNNGYKVRFVTTEDKFDEACERYYEKLNTKNLHNRICYNCDKESAQKHNCSVKVYRAAYKTFFEKDEKGNYRYTAMSLEDWIEYYKEHPEYL